MRSRKPEMRATMSTRRELSVCATKVMTCGIVCGVTVLTDTCGAGRCGAGASLEQPAAIQTARNRVATRMRRLIVLRSRRAYYGTKVQCLGRGVAASVAAMSNAPRILAAALAALAGAARADDIIQPGEEKFTVMLGAFLPAFRSKVQVDGEQTGPGDRVDLDRDLGADRNSSGGWFGVDWRFAPRHRLGFTYSRFTLSGDRVIDRDLHIGDRVFPIGAELQSQLRLEIAPITYSYSFLKQDNDELALTAGLHWSRLSFHVQGSASFGARSGSDETDAKANVPLPLHGLRYDHRFSQRWSAGASAAAFALRFGEGTFEFEGSLVSARLHAEYRFTRHLAAGAALDAFKVNAKAQQREWTGGFDYGYWGPQVYLMARF